MSELVRHLFAGSSFPVKMCKSQHQLGGTLFHQLLEVVTVPP